MLLDSISFWLTDVYVIFPLKKTKYLSSGFEQNLFEINCHRTININNNNRFKENDVFLAQVHVVYAAAALDELNH